MFHIIYDGFMVDDKIYKMKLYKEVVAINPEECRINPCFDKNLQFIFV